MSKERASSLEDRPAVLLLASLHTAQQRFGSSDEAESPPWILTRESEVIRIVDLLAGFRPSRVAVEVRPKDVGEVQARYERYVRGEEPLGSSEIDQFAFRVAQRCNIDLIKGFDADWQLNWDGLRALYPEDPDLEMALAEHLPVSARAHERVRELGESGASVAEVLRWVNSSEFQEADHRAYIRVAEMGDGQNTGGADYTASWYLRNLRIYANLCRIAFPSERVFAIVGSGHAKIINDLIRQGGRFEVADTLEYLT